MDILLYYMEYIYHIYCQYILLSNKCNIRFSEKKRACTSLNHLSPSLVLTLLLNMHETMLVSSHATCHLSKFCCYKILFDRKQITEHQGGITCGAIDEPRKFSKAIDKRVIIDFCDKNVIIARFRDQNEVFI